MPAHTGFCHHHKLVVKYCVHFDESLPTLQFDQHHHPLLDDYNTETFTVIYVKNLKLYLKYCFVPNRGYEVMKYYCFHKIQF